MARGGHGLGGFLHAGHGRDEAGPLSELVPPGSEKWVGVSLRVGAIVAFHPFEYAKTLIQIGFEPLPARQTKTLLGKPALALPSVFRYVGFIRERDGFLGLYAGLLPRVLGLGAASLATNAFNSYWPAPPKSVTSVGERSLTNDSGVSLPDREEKEEREAREMLLREMTRDSALCVTRILATQPFHVLAVRAMAQFVGKEHKYDGFLSGIGEVINENGILGFWSGWIPRAIGEVSLICLSSSLTFFINRYVVTDSEIKQYTSHIVGFLASSLVYPFAVVGNTMAVSKSGLAAGYPPRMPLYRGWRDCFRHLSEQKQLKRGSSLLFRYYTGPQVIVGDKVMPINRSVF